MAALPGLGVERIARFFPPDPGRLSAVVLIALIFCVIGAFVLRADWLGALARILLLAYLLLEWPGIQRTGRVILGAAAAVMAAVILTGDEPLAVIGAGLDQGAFFATFLANQFFLREPARGSPVVHRCASFFIDQPPSRRYGLLTLGGYLFGTILNLGALSLLGLMIRRRNSLAAAGGHAAVHEVRTRRMVTAVLRGFAVAPLGSPISMMMAVVLTLLPGVIWTQIFPLTLVAVALFLTIGWVQDRVESPRHLAHLAPAIAGRWDARPLLRLLMIVIGIFALALGIELAVDLPLSRAVLVAVPTAGLIWLALQHRRFGPLRGSRLIGRRLVREGARVFPRYRTEIAILASAGFIGTLFTTLVAQGWLGQLLTLLPVAPVLIPPVLMALIVALSLLGLNPIVMVTIFAAGFQGVTDFAVSPTMLGLALMCGWAISVNLSPLTAAAMVIGELAGRPAREVTLVWNRRYALLCLGLIGVWLAALTSIMG